MPPKLRSSGKRTGIPLAPPSAKKSKGAGLLSSSSSSSSGPTSSSSSTSASDYRNFLNNHIKPRLGTEVDTWYEPTPASDPQAQIINELARKFNMSGGGLDAATFNKYKLSKGKPDSNSYYSVGGGTPLQRELSLVSNPDSSRMGPDPSIVGHELVHANDHQIDRLNPKVWQHLGTLANTGGAGGKPMKTLSQLNKSLKKIQNKIDPLKAFAQYSIGNKYIKQEMEGATGKWYSLPSALKPKVFNDINTLLTSPSSAGGVGIENPGFHLNIASEFPAYMMERLPLSWRTGQQTGNLTGKKAKTGEPAPREFPALNLEEARFLANTLNSMDTAYPDPQYPVINEHIKKRRKSLSDAFPRLSHGGRVIGDKLLYPNPIISNILPKK